MFSIHLLSLTITAVINFILIGVLVKRKERSVMHASFVVMLILVNMWTISQLAMNVLPMTDYLFKTLENISLFGFVILPIPCVIFSLAFTDRLSALRSYFRSFLLIIPSIIFTYLAWTTNLIEMREHSQVIHCAWGYEIPKGPLFPIFLVWFTSLIIFAIGNIIYYYRTAIDIERKKQARWFIIAFTLPFIVGIIANSFSLLFDIPTFPFAIPLLGITMITLAYAILRYELFEISPNTILSSLGNGIITVNRYGKIIHMNSSARDFLNLQNTPVSNKSLHQVITMHEEGQRADKRNLPLSSVLQSGEKISSSSIYMSARGKKKIPVGCTITPITHGKKIVGATIIFRDITQEKELEKSKNEFISIASHELKTPITSIKGFSQILESRLQLKRDKKSKYFIANINEQLDKITTLINDLLNVSRMEEGRLVLHKKRFDINELVEKVIVGFQYTTKTHQILKKGTDKILVFADAERIHQVLINLLTNAVKYSPHAKEVIVSVSKNGNTVVVSVQDFGIGISKKHLQNIFTRFYRSSDSGGENIAGFGLGLYICAEIMKRHNGKIWVESKQGKGSTFSFSLPIE